MGKAYLKLACTVILAASFLLLSGFRAQTIIHDDGSETQDVLKVSDTAEGQKKLRADADEFQKRNYTIMDYNNANGQGFRAMKTITKEGANRSSVDRIVHKTHDGFICSTYYIDYTFNSDSLQSLRLGMAMEENGADLEYIVSFPSGTQVESNSNHADEQGSTYMWSLKQNEPTQIKLQATVWHKLFIYLTLSFIVLIIVIVLFMEHRRRNVISWKKAAHMRKVEMMLLCLPIILLGYMGYEYYVGTHVTADTLAKVSEQQQEELLESREEDRRLQNAGAQKQRIGEAAAARIRSKTMEISSSLRELNRSYRDGSISQREARAQAGQLASQAQELLSGSKDLSQADRDVLQQLVDQLVSEAESVGSAPEPVRTPPSREVSEEQRRADAIAEEAEQEAEQQAEKKVEKERSSDAAGTESSAKNTEARNDRSSKSQEKKNR